MRRLVETFRCARASCPAQHVFELAPVARLTLRTRCRRSRAAAIRAATSRSRTSMSDARRSSRLGFPRRRALDPSRPRDEIVRSRSFNPAPDPAELPMPAQPIRNRAAADFEMRSPTALSKRAVSCSRSRPQDSNAGLQATSTGTRGVTRCAPSDASYDAQRMESVVLIGCHAISGGMTRLAQGRLVALDAVAARRSESV